MEIKAKFQKLLAYVTGTSNQIDKLMLELKAANITIDCLEKDKAFHRAENEKLKESNEELITGKYKGHDDHVAIDFNNPDITIFSIERLWDHDSQCPMTVIVVKDGDKLVDQYFYVSDEKHLALLVEFNASLSTKRMKGK